MSAFLRLEDASAHYGGPAVFSGLSLCIAAGEKVAVVGESGAGKSTLLAHLRAQRPADIAWCPQSQGLVPVLSVFHNIYMGRLDRHSTLYNFLNLLAPRESEREAVGLVATRLGLSEKLFTSVDRLSGGQQQRVAVGRAMFAGRPVFIGDEPVSAVDPYQAREIIRMINQSHDTVVLALHDIGLALSCCDRVIGLGEGRVLLDAPAAALTTRDLAPLYRRQPTP